MTMLEQSDQRLKQTLQSAYPARAIDVRSALFAKINSGALTIAPRRSLVLLRRLLIASHVALVLLTTAAIVTLIQALSNQETWIYLKESLAALSDYRDLAWMAFWESVPTASLLFVAVALTGLIGSFILHRRLRQQHLLTNS
jgi:hypothetical protein